MSTDLRVQLRDYIDSISEPVEVEDIISPVVRPQTRPIPPRGPVVAVVVAAAVLAFSMVAVLLRTDPGVEPAEIVDPIPTNHPALQLLEEGVADSDDLSRLADERGMQFSCGEGGEEEDATGERVRWHEICIVPASGTMVIIPFQAPPGTSARITSQGVPGEVVIPLEPGEPVGVSYAGGTFTMSIEHAGESIGRLETHFPDVNPGTQP